jgi:mono/diheme cytochrome c family protein/preprotein translocase subunit YajC
MSNLEKFIKEKREEIRKDPGKIFGLVYPYVLLIGLGIGLYYISQMNSIGRQEVPVAVPDTTNTPEVLTIQESRLVPAADVKKLSQPTDSLVEMGKKIFQTTCVSCHGSDGRGDGPASTGLNPSPRNFTSKEGWVNGPKLTSIYETLQEGIKGSAMVAYQQFTPTEKFALAHYIRTTFVPDPPPPTESDLTMLDQLYNLSQKRFIPAQIPVADAETLIIRENQKKVEEIKNIAGKIEKDQSTASGLFKQITSNKDRALTILLNSDGWKNNEQEFIDIIVNNVNQDGFNGEVYNLSDSEWNELFNYLKSVIA